MTVMARVRLGALAALVGTTLTACDGDDGISPGTFDPETTAAAMGEMVAANDEMDEAWVGMSLAGSLFENTSSAELLPVGGPILMDPASTLRYADGLGTAAFFPENYLGVTFVWRAQGQQGYEPSEEPGAPEDGIRVIYYALNDAGTAPARPLTALGYIDLRDLSTASSDRLGVKVERTAGEALTLADYFIDLSYSMGSGSMTVAQASEGYLSNGTDRLDFDLSNEATISETELVLDQAYEMSLAGTDVRVSYEGSVSSDWEGENTTVSLNATVAGSGTSVRFEVDMDGELLGGSVYHGNTLVATISGTGDQPVFTNASTGEELTAAQLEALAEVFQGLEGLFELVAGIFGITE